MTRLRAVFVHDWLNGMRGGEKCLELAADLFPQAPIYTLFYERGKVSDAIASHPIRTSWLSHLPGVREGYRNYLPLYPSAIESMRLPSCDLVLSMSHCVAKGAVKPRGAAHLCYCFTPARWAWGFFDEYFGSKRAFSRFLIRGFLKRLREWDRQSARRVDHFVAISQHIRKRIRGCYDRDSEVVYPPVNTRFYEPDHRLSAVAAGAGAKTEDFYLVVSALTPYKRVDLAVLAAKKLGKRLIVIGEGPERRRLSALAGKETEFLGWQPEAVLRDHYRRARALLFPGEEDFGIVPVEMQACGGFVIAYGKGGALETVMDGETGLFFGRQKADSLAEAMRCFETAAWNPDAPRKNAERFSQERFIMEMKSVIQRAQKERNGR